MARNRTVAAVLGAFAWALGAGCTDDSVSIRIDCVIPPSADCSYAAEGDLCQSRGLLNLQVAQRYVLGLRVFNNLSARARTSPPLAETNGVEVTGFDVKVFAASGDTYDFGSLPNPFFAASTAYAEPGGGQSAVGAIVLPPDYVDVLRRNEGNARTKVSSLLLKLSVRGVTDGREDVESAGITFPLELASASANYAEGDCVAAEGDICLLGQDADAFACEPSTVPE